MKTLIVIPTYNERNNLDELTARVFEHAPDAHLLLVDDNSPDGTGAYAETLIRELYPSRLFVLHREGKGGLGPAYIAGFRFALERGYDRIVQMDGDLSHDPAHLPAIRSFCDSSWDVALGSRYIDGGDVVNWDVKRLALSRLAGQYARFVLGIPYTDPTGGFKCWRADALRSLDLSRVFSNGYLFQIEMTYKAHRRGLRIAETPIVFYERKVGVSKMNWNIIFEAVFGVVRLRLQG